MGRIAVNLRRDAIIIAMLLIPLVTSCISQTDFVYLDEQVNELSKRVAQLRASQEALEKKIGADLETSLDAIRANQVGLHEDIDQIRKEMKDLSGRVEDNEHVIKRVVERDLSEQDAIRDRLASLDTQIAELERMVRGEPRTPLPAGPPGAKLQRRIPPEEGRVERPTPRPPVIEEKKSPEMELYDASLAVYKEGRFEEAIDHFKEFLKKYPTSDLADNAHFWIGESLMALKQYEKAILAYQDVIKKYPSGNKVPNAMLRQALAFLEIKDSISARLLLKKIIRNYPGSNEAKIAQTKLKQIQ